MLKHLSVAPAVFEGGDRDMANHLPFDAILAPFKAPETIALKPRAAEVSQQARCGGGIEQDEACCSCKPLRQASGVVAVYDPVRARKHLIMQSDEFFIRPGAANPYSARGKAGPGESA